MLECFVKCSETRDVGIYKRSKSIRTMTFLFCLNAEHAIILINSNFISLSFALFLFIRSFVRSLVKTHLLKCLIACLEIAILSKQGSFCVCVQIWGGKLNPLFQQHLPRHSIHTTHTNVKSCLILKFAAPANIVNTLM